MQIGEQATIGWNSAKELGSEGIAYSEVRLEMIAHDWLVFRDCSGRAHAVAFGSCTAKNRFLKEITQ